MNKEIWPIDRLRNWDQNPRSIKEKDFTRLKKQIQELGQYKPLLVTPDGEVIGGNMRLRAYLDLGVTDIWVSVVNPKNDDEKLRYALSDNDRAGYYDDDLLANLSSAYPDFEWKDYAVDMMPPQSLDDWINANKEVVEDEVPKVESGEAVSRLGEVYQLGRHRLMCGDSTKLEDVDRLMDGKKADMVFTDPPYGVSYAAKNEYLNSIATGNRIQTPIENDHMNLEDTSNFIYECFVNLRLLLANKSSYYITAPQGGDLLLLMMMTMQKADLPLRHMLIWVKNNHVLGRTDYNYKHEPILYGWVDTHKFYGNGTHRFSTWEIDKPLKNDLPPTMKPIELIINAIQNSTLRDMVVADLFLGSGSTLIACEQTNRICYGMELDPQYCDVIRKRYARFIGKEGEWEKETPKI